MARYILFILISTVASESAFSVGGKVLDQYCNTLKPKIVEALLCLRDWLFDKEGSFYFILNCVFIWIYENAILMFLYC